MVEVMLAIVVLLVAATAAFSSQVTSMRLIKQSREQAVALSDLQACMEAVRMIPVDELPIVGSVYAHGAEVPAYDDLHLRDQTLVVTYPGYTPGGAIPDPLQVRIVTTWVDDRGGERNMQLRTVRAR
jgi:type II secretory pathway pseudopilin PulG